MNEEKQLSEKIINFLEEHNTEIFSKTELVEIMKVPERIMSSKLNKLLQHKEVNCEKISFRVARKVYGNNGLKRGMRLFFLE